MRLKVNMLVAFLLILTVIVPAISANADTTMSSNIYYVSDTLGADGNIGSESSPFKTIGKAASVMDAGDICYIMGGTYRETVTVNKSGTAEKPITFAPYDDAEVIINAAEVSKNWTLETVNGVSVYTAVFSEPIDAEDWVFYDTKALQYAKWPNNTGIDNNPYRSSVCDTDGIAADEWMFSTWAIADSTAEKYTVYDLELDIEDGAFDGATFVSPSGSGWYMQKAQVTDSGNGFFKLKAGDITDHEYYLPKEGNPYYICGTKNALDAPGEWFFESGTQKLYVVAPVADNFDPDLLEVKQRDYVFELNGNDHIVISGITCFGGTVEMKDSDGIIIEDCNISYASEELDISGSLNKVKDCTIRYNPGAHIIVSGKNNEIRGNYIEYSNILSQNGSIVLGSGAYQNTVAYNTLRFASVSGINFGLARRTLIYGNDISYFGAICNDNGGLYCGNTDGVNSEIAYNRIHDSMASPGFGIYTDNGSSNIVIHHNVVFNCGGSFQANMPMTNILVYNNTFAGKTGVGNYAVRNTDGCRFVNNIVQDGSVLEYTAYDSSLGSYDRRVIMNYNNLYLSEADLTSLKNANFIPSKDFYAVDKGVKLEGINDDYNGAFPDIGAFEYGDTPWLSGAENDDGSTMGYTDCEFINHILDGGFEISVSSDIEESTSWIKTGDGEAIITERTAENPAEEIKRHNGNGGIRIGSDVSNDGIKQTVYTLKPNTKYKLTAWGRTENSVPVTMSVNGAKTEIVQDCGNDALFSLDIAGESAYTDFILADVGIGKDGRKIYGLIALDADRGYIGIEEDTDYSVGGVKFATWTTASTSGVEEYEEIEETALSKYPADMAEHILRTDWQIGDYSGSKYIVRSKIGFGTTEQLTDYFDYLRESQSHVKRTISRNIFEWDGSMMLKTVRRNTTSGIVEVGSTLNWENSCLYHYMVYVDSDFFKSIPLKTMGDSVKYRLRSDYTKSELSNVYTEEMLSEIGFDTETPDITGVSFDSSVWTKKEIVFTTGESGTVTVNFDTDISGFGYLDDVSITENSDVGPVNEKSGNISEESSADSLSFTTDSKSFTILDTTGDEYLVLSNDLYGIYAYDSRKYQRFDPNSSLNLGYTINSQSILPDSLSDYVNKNHIWQTEAGHIYGNSPEDYDTMAGVTVLSYSEFAAYAHRIKRIQPSDENALGWWLRTGCGTADGENMVMYVSFYDSALVSKITSDIQLHVRPAFYLNRDFFKNVRIENMGSAVKSMLINNFTAGELIDIYTPGELQDIGFDDISILKVSGGRFSLGGREYILTDYTDTNSDKTYFGILSTAKKSGTWQKSLMQLTGLSYDADIIYYASKAADAEGANIQSFREELFPTEAFGSHLLQREWVMSEEIGPAGAKTAYISVGEIGLPSVEEFMVICENNDIEVAEGDRYLMTRDMGFYQDYYYLVRYNPSAKATSNIAFDSSMKTVSGGTWYFMAYVSEDFFKSSKADISSMGSDAKRIIAENIPRYEMEQSNVYSEDELDMLYSGNINDTDYGIYCEGELSGEILRLKCSINNNTDTALPYGTLLLVPLYNKENSMVMDIKIFETAVEANSFTLPFVAEFGIDADKKYFTRPMLWANSKNCMPLCKAIEYEQ